MADYLSKEELVQIGRRIKDWYRDSTKLNDIIDGVNTPVYETVRYIGYLGGLRLFLNFDHSLVNPDSSMDQYRISALSDNKHHLGSAYSKQNTAGELGELFISLEENFNKPVEIKQLKKEEKKDPEEALKQAIKQARALAGK